MFEEPFFTPYGEIEGRIENLQSQLQQSEIDAALILQKADLFYFSGTVQQAHLYVPADDAPVLLAHKDFGRAVDESPIHRKYPLDSPKEILSVLNRCGIRPPSRLGMELDVLPTNLFFRYREIFDPARISDISPAVRMIRSVKSKFEIDLVKAAVRFSDAVAEGIAELIEEGMTEIELAGLIEARARRLGHQGTVRMRLWGSELFYGHLMSGANAAVPSFLSSPTGGRGIGPAVAQGPALVPIAAHEPILVDYVFAYQGYLSDHARIFSIGELSDELNAAHETALGIQESIKKKALPGTKAGDLYEYALEAAKSAGYEAFFMGHDPRRISFVGHGIGIELDEFPFLARGQRLRLEKDMLIALEPKFVIPGKGVVGIENTHIVTERGLEQLGRFTDEIVVV